MRSEVVTLGLQKTLRQSLGAVAVEEGERGREGRRGQTHERGVGDDATPSGLSLVDGFVEEVVEQQVLELPVGRQGMRTACARTGCPRTPW